MLIQKHTVKDLHEVFKDFFENLYGCNYVIAHDVNSFSFSGNFDFKLDDLSLIVKTIGPASEAVEGTINNLSFEEVTKKIHACLLCPWGPTQAPNTLEVFWNLVNQYFILPPVVCYEHDPSPESCFTFGVQWNFCFILLNEHYQGIVIYAGAAD